MTKYTNLVFSESDIIQMANKLRERQNNDPLTTINEAIAYLESQNYGHFYQIAEEKPQIINLTTFDQSIELIDFLKTYDDLNTFTNYFVDQEVEVTFEEDWLTLTRNKQEIEAFNALTDEQKEGYALGHAYSLLNQFFYSPLSKLLNYYDLDVINDNWLTRVRLEK